MPEHPEIPQPPSPFDALREKAGDGSTDFVVEIWQSDLTALLDAIPPRTYDDVLDEGEAWGAYYRGEGPKPEATP